MLNSLNRLFANRSKRLLAGTISGLIYDPIQVTFTLLQKPLQ